MGNDKQADPRADQMVEECITDLQQALVESGVKSTFQEWLEGEQHEVFTTGQQIADLAFFYGRLSGMAMGMGMTILELVDSTDICA